MMDYLIKGALVAGETDEAVCDVLIHDGRIAEIGRFLAPPRGNECEIINADGMILVPGGVDVHTHLTLEAGNAAVCDDFYTGTAAAAFGGTTCIVDHPGFGPPDCPLAYQIDAYHERARDKALIDYGFHGVIQRVDDAVLKDMGRLAAEGITSYKIYLTYNYKIDDGGALRVLERGRELGTLTTVHCENDGVLDLLRGRFLAKGKRAPRFHPQSRPAECEAEAVSRMCLWARLAGNAPLYIVHLSSELGLKAVRAARENGQRRLFAETCPQYLFLDRAVCEGAPEEAVKYLMCPPPRSRDDREALWAALSAGEIDTVATDHCPFLMADKLAGKDDFTRCPSGAPGVEERMPLLFSEGVMKNRLSLRRFVELCCTEPARLCGLYPQKGVIRPGSDADIALFDPARDWTLRAETLHGRADYCAYEGFRLRGYPAIVFSRGEIIVRGGELHGRAGRGRFIARTTFQAD
jgi:dihydropyrimidinase